jgi:hypothetical protein
MVDGVLIRVHAEFDLGELEREEQKTISGEESIPTPTFFSSRPSAYTSAATLP